MTIAQEFLTLIEKEPDIDWEEITYRLNCSKNCKHKEKVRKACVAATYLAVTVHKS